MVCWVFSSKNGVNQRLARSKMSGSMYLIEVGSVSIWGKITDNLGLSGGFRSSLAGKQDKRKVNEHKKRGHGPLFYISNKFLFIWNTYCHTIDESGKFGILYILENQVGDLSCVIHSNICRLVCREHSWLGLFDTTFGHFLTVDV